MFEQVIKYISLHCLAIGGITTILGATFFNKEVTIIGTGLAVFALILIEILQLTREIKEKKGN